MSITLLEDAEYLNMNVGTITCNELNTGDVVLDNLVVDNNFQVNGDTLLKGEVNIGVLGSLNTNAMKNIYSLNGTGGQVLATNGSGLVSWIDNGSGGSGVSSITFSGSFTGTPSNTITSVGSVDLLTQSVTTNTYNNANVSVNNKGIITGITGSTPVLSLTAGTNVTLSGTSQNPIINSTGGGGGGTVTSVSSADSSLTVTNGTAAADVVIKTQTGVVANPYSNANVTVNSQGIITAISPSTPILSLTAGTNISITSGQNPTISATGAAVGVSTVSTTNPNLIVAPTTGDVDISMTSNPDFSTLTTTGTIACGTSSGSLSIGPSLNNYVFPSTYGANNQVLGMGIGSTSFGWQSISINTTTTSTTVDFVIGDAIGTVLFSPTINLVKTGCVVSGYIILNSVSVVLPGFGGDGTTFYSTTALPSQFWPTNVMQVGICYIGYTVITTSILPFSIAIGTDGIVFITRMDSNNNFTAGTTIITNPIANGKFNQWCFNYINVT